jgi:hypothetical protein
MSLKSEAQKSKPAHEFRLGNVKATIWKNESEDGLRYNVTFSRSYLVGEEWKRSESFGRDDLLKVMKCADLAHGWILGTAVAEESEAA